MLKVTIPPDHIDVEKAVIQLRKLDEMFTELNFQYCLCGGTLLGLMRHKAIMPWDDDIDILMQEDHMLILEEELKALDLHVVRDAHVSTYSEFEFMIRVDVDGIFIDFWPAKYDGKNILTCAGPYHPSEVFPLRRFQFYDFSVCVPRNPYSFLERLVYSSIWRTWDDQEIRWDNTIVKKLDKQHLSHRFLLEEFKGPLPEQTEL